VFRNVLYAIWTAVIIALLFAIYKAFVALMDKAAGASDAAGKVAKKVADAAKTVERAVNPASPENLANRGLNALVSPFFDDPRDSIGTAFRGVVERRQEANRMKASPVDDPTAEDYASFYDRPFAETAGGAVTGMIRKP
jgi:hypothetical protein